MFSEFGVFNLYKGKHYESKALAARPNVEVRAIATIVQDLHYQAVVQDFHLHYWECWKDAQMGDNFNKKLKTGKTEEDWISRLPNEVICHILSFLRTKDAIATSALAKSWRYLWRSLDSYEFEDDCLQVFSDKIGPKSGFFDFVDGVVICSNVLHIRRLRLVIELKYSSSRIVNWIRTACMRGVEEFDINIFGMEITSLPKCFFDCKTLVILRLSFCFFGNFSTSLCFPNLKFLHLNSVITFGGDDPINKFLTGSPSLEEFKFYGTHRGDIGRASVNSLRLKRLLVSVESELTNFTVYNADPVEQQDDNILVATPSLEHLYFCVPCLTDFKVNELPLLQKANLDFSRCSKQMLYSKKFNKGMNEILRNISKVKHLQLTKHEYMYQVDLHSSDYELPSFINMTCLEMQVVFRWDLMFKLLECSPNLEVLICSKVSSCTRIHNSLYAPTDCSLWSRPIERVPECLSSHLDRVELGGFEGCQNEVKLMKYFLTNAKMLNRMVICCASKFSQKRETEFLEELLPFPWASTTCQVEFY